MEEEKMGKIVEAETTDEKKEEAVVNVPTRERKKHGSVVAITFATLALLLAITSTVLSILSYQKSSTPLTILGGSGVDGNSANFVEGSVADIVSKVSESVVSIVTSIKTTGYFGMSYDSSAAGTGIVVTEDGYILTNKHVK